MGQLERARINIENEHRQMVEQYGSVSEIVTRYNQIIKKCSGATSQPHQL
ncbi:hypothetical protein ACFSJQ_16155 [Vibrio olivae]